MPASPASSTWAATWLVPALALGVTAAAVISYGRNEERQAAPGSPYYDKAVREAISSLAGAGGESLPGARPALAAGLAPEDYYWCENCKTYHKRDANSPAQPVAAGAAPATPDGSIPPLPEGLSAEDYYWCVNCQTYHQREGAAQGGAPAWGGVPFRHPAVVPPPDP